MILLGGSPAEIRTFLEHCKTLAFQTQWLFFTCFGIIKSSQEWAERLRTEHKMSLSGIKTGYTVGSVWDGAVGDKGR